MSLASCHSDMSADMSASVGVCGIFGCSSPEKHCFLSQSYYGWDLIILLNLRCVTAQDKERVVVTLPTSTSESVVFIARLCLYGPFHLRTLVPHCVQIFCFSQKRVELWMHDSLEIIFNQSFCD